MTTGPATPQDPVPPPSAAPDLLDTPQAGPAAIRGGALRAVGYGATLVLSLASVPLLTRHLGVVDFGRYVLVLSLLTIVAGLTEGGLNAIALREHATVSGPERDLVLRSLLGIRILLAAVAVAIAVGFAGAAGYGRTLVLGTLVAGVGLVLQLIQTFLAVALQSRLRFGWLTAIDVIRQAVTVGLIVGLVLAGARLIPLLAASIPAGLVTLVATGVLVRRLTPLRPAFHAATWWPLVRDTLPYAAAIAVNVVYFRLAIVLMSLLTSGRETGYFATSFRFVEVLIGVPGIVIGAAFPILARAARDDAGRFSYASQRILELAAFVGVWLALCTVLIAPFAISVIAPSTYEPAVPVLRIQALAVIATFLAVAGGYSLLSLRRHRAMLVANLSALVANVALLFVLVPLFEARGAAVATVAAEAALAAAVIALLARAPEAGRLSPGSMPFVIVAGGMGGAVAAVSGLHPLVQVVIATLIYLGILAASGRIPTELGEFVGGYRAKPAG